MIPDFIQSKREEILQAAAKHGAVNIRLFGSSVHGAMNDDSDVDFLVEMGQNTSPFFPGGLLVELQELLNRKVDIATPNGLKDRIREKVLREAVEL